MGSDVASKLLGEILHPSVPPRSTRITRMIVEISMEKLHGFQKRCTEKQSSWCTVYFFPSVVVITTHLLSSPIKGLTQRPTLVHVSYNSSHLNFDVFSFPSCFIRAHVVFLLFLISHQRVVHRTIAILTTTRLVSCMVALPRIKGTSDCCFKASEENGNRLTSVCINQRATGYYWCFFEDI